MSNSKIPHLTLITVSGAQATGKTTLLGDLSKCFAKFDNLRVVEVESCSSLLFRRIQSGDVKLPPRKCKPKNYDDINRLGLRPFFQRGLPDALAFVLEAAVLRASADADPCSRAIVLVDRWFTDILAYTAFESKDEALYAEILEQCRRHLDTFQSWVLTHAETVRIINVFVPVASARFTVAPTEKFRASCDQEAWEAVCLARWTDLTADHRGMFKITASSRTQRVGQILSHISDGLPDPLTA